MEDSPKPVEHSAEDDARLLGKAHEVRSDKKRMKAITMHMRNMTKAVAAGKVGRKGMSHGLAKRIAAGKVTRRTSKGPRHARGRR